MTQIVKPETSAAGQLEEALQAATREQQLCYILRYTLGWGVERIARLVQREKAHVESELCSTLMLLRGKVGPRAAAAQKRSQG